MNENVESFPEDNLPDLEPEPTPVPAPKPLISDVTYDRMKKLVQFILPAAGTLYFTLAQIWGLPNGEQVVGTITAIALFGGVALGFSKKSYNASDAKYDGEIVLEPEEDGLKVYGLDIQSTKETWDGKTDLTLKVVRPE